MGRQNDKDRENNKHYDPYSDNEVSWNATKRRINSPLGVIIVILGIIAVIVIITNS